MVRRIHHCRQAIGIRLRNGGPRCTCALGYSEHLYLFDAVSAWQGTFCVSPVQNSCSQLEVMV
jgi:hypothetical protein